MIKKIKITRATTLAGIEVYPDQEYTVLSEASVSKQILKGECTLTDARTLIATNKAAVVEDGADDKQKTGKTKKSEKTEKPEKGD